MKKKEKFIQNILNKIIINLYIIEYKISMAFGVFGIFFFVSYLFLLYFFN